MTMHLEEAELLRQQGHRLTPQRLQVLQVIKAHGHHATAEEIHAAIVPQQPYLSIATVYRALQWLQSVGLVAPITIEGKLCYEYHVPGDHHHHLVCQQCRQHLQVSNEVFAVLRETLRERYGFMLDADHLALMGLCAACDAEKQQTDPPGG